MLGLLEVAAEREHLDEAEAVDAGGERRAAALGERDDVGHVAACAGEVSGEHGFEAHAELCVHDGAQRAAVGDVVHFVDDHRERRGFTERHVAVGGVDHQRRVPGEEPEALRVLEGLADQRLGFGEFS